MENKHIKEVAFFSEMAERQISAREFFSVDLLQSLQRNFGLKRMLISYFDIQGNFLSWVSLSGLYTDCEAHPYRNFHINDVIRHKIFQEAVRDNLTYFNITPRLYKSSDIIPTVDYNTSAYVRFLEENFNSHYSVTLAFGMNAYIQVAFLKTTEEGDFTQKEIETLNKIYTFLAYSYKNFKKYEQRKIVSMLQNKIIESHEKAFFITDNFMHVLSYNKEAIKYIADIFGEIAVEKIRSEDYCTWLPHILENSQSAQDSDIIKRLIKNYIFKIHIYDQSYSNKIIDRYYLITVSCTDDNDKTTLVHKATVLTKTEQEVADLIYRGLTYKAIAKELVVSYHTVKKHVQNIYSKCGVNSRHELYHWLERKD